VEAGLGIALLPRSSFREEQVRGSIRTVEVDGLRFEQPVVVVRRRGRFENPAAAAFLALLRRTTPASLSGRLTRKKG
jgi:DNA-binding transcriptional LysR family regulator